jgi:hypothetical protein
VRVASSVEVDTLGAPEKPHPGEKLRAANVNHAARVRPLMNTSPSRLIEPDAPSV